jgi:competence protein CoiA
VLVALSDEPLGGRISATPGVSAVCPLCHERVRPKCGRIVCWHFAHLAATDCDRWSDGETDWHREWKLTAPIERREVIIGCHRADVVTSDGTVVEFQHSSISPAEIAEREQFYGPRMVWVFDVADAYRNTAPAGWPPNRRLDLRHRPAPWTALDRRYDDPTYRTFRWKHARKSIATCRRPVVLDLGVQSLLRLGRMYPDAPTGGYGHIEDRSDFVAWLTAPPEELFPITELFPIAEAG